MRIALDAMGGDHAPAPNIEGAIAALRADSSLELCLVGDERTLFDRINRSQYSGDRLTVVAANGFVRMDEKPTEALRRKPNSSVNVCWRLMASQDVDAVVSAGHTGAMVAAGLRTRLFLRGVKRPGIAVALPTLRGRSVLIDVGANPTARPDHLYQYAVMGTIYARDVLGIADPKIGLINIGSEEGKGTDLYRDAHTLLANSRLKDRYLGNIEGRGLYNGDADVLVCEGFVGNVVLKVSEGMAQYMVHAVKQEMSAHLDHDREVALEALKRLSQRYHSSEEGGAPLLGIDGISIICHGSSDAQSISNALKVATTFKNRQINAQIAMELTS